MILKELTPPDADPISMAELAAHLRLNHGFADTGVEDALLQLYLRNATAAIEARLGQALMRRPFQLETDCWDRKGQLTMPIGPITAVTAFSFNRADEVIPVAPSALQLSMDTSRQVLSGPGKTALPALPAGAVARIVFEAGHGSIGLEVPGPLRQAVLILAAHLYENRSSGDAEAVPTRVSALIAPHRAVRL